MSNVYLSRLITLVRFEKLTKKDSGRSYRYQRGYGMVAAHPLAGHGIGSFYLTGLKYASSTDPEPERPDFAHNIILQIATEQGVPIAALFAGLISWVLYSGIRSWYRQETTAKKSSAHALNALGVTLALGAYLETGMTGNSLNVYVSNQFFFWFLMAEVLAASQRECVRERESEGESGRGKIAGIVSGSM
jgi:O-antigen ligase